MPLNVKGLRLFLEYRLEQELRQNHIADSLWVLSIGQNFKDRERFIDMIKPQEKKSADEIKNNIKNKINERR